MFWDWYRLKCSIPQYKSNNPLLLVSTCLPIYLSKVFLWLKKIKMALFYPVCSFFKQANCSYAVFKNKGEKNRIAIQLFLLLKLNKSCLWEKWVSGWLKRRITEEEEQLAWRKQSRQMGHFDFTS